MVTQVDTQRDSFELMHRWTQKAILNDHSCIYAKHLVQRAESSLLDRKCPDWTGVEYANLNINTLEVIKKSCDNNALNYTD